VLLKLSNILKPVLNPIIFELESIISPIHIPFVGENQDSILLHRFELAQNFENHLDILASYPFSEIELGHECDPDPPVDNSISLFDSIMTAVSLPDIFHIPESTLNSVPVHRDIKLPIFYDLYDHISLMEKVCEH